MDMNNKSQVDDKWRDESGNEWPPVLDIRDTQLNDDVSGGGQRIYTTAGSGYKRQRYVRADLAMVRAPGAPEPDRDRLKGVRHPNLEQIADALAIVPVWDDPSVQRNAIELLRSKHVSEEHDLYKDGDPDAPAGIKDANGEVVLGLCRRCGRAEAELVEPCVIRTSAKRLGLMDDPWVRAMRDVGTAFRGNTKHFSSRCMPGGPAREVGEVGEVDGVVIQGMVDCSKAGMLRADDATEHMKAQEADWQRVCDALGADGEHMDPDDVVAAIEQLKRGWPNVTHEMVTAAIAAFDPGVPLFSSMQDAIAAALNRMPKAGLGGWGEARDFHGPFTKFRFRPHLGGPLPGGRPGKPDVIDGIMCLNPNYGGRHEAFMMVLPYAEAFIGQPYSKWLAIPKPKL
jgi:hypothetical protein